LCAQHRQQPQKRQQRQQRQQPQQKEEENLVNDIYHAIQKEDQAKLANLLSKYIQLSNDDVSEFFYFAIDKKLYNAIEVFLEMDLIKREELIKIINNTKDRHLKNLLEL